MCDDPSQGQRTQGREVSEECAIKDWSAGASDVDIQLLKERDMAIKIFDDICRDIYVDGQGFDSVNMWGHQEECVIEVGVVFVSSEDDVQRARF